jgi:peptidoglycan/LPS O-acetylase OafA/YrhL
MKDLNKSSMEKIVPLDGLRGLAILLVLFHHSVVHSPYTFSPAAAHVLFHYLGEEASCGVDLFFALSGFLITRILIHARSYNEYYRTFYIRRFLRIFPIYYAFLVGILLLSTILRYVNRPILFESLRGQYGLLVSLFAYLSNFWMFFVPGLDNVLVAQAWSLSIEEQFYLSWPAIVKHFSLKVLILILSILPIACLIVRYFLIASGHSIWQIRIFTFGRLDALGDGALLCILLTCYKARFLKWRLSGFAVLFVSFIYYWYMVIFQHGLLSLWGHLLMPFICTVAVYLVVTAPTNSLTARLFSTRVLVAFGKYSYSIYLLHMLVLCAILPLFGTSSTHIFAKCIMIFITLSSLMLVVGALVFKYYEQYFLGLKDKLAPLRSNN